MNYITPWIENTMIEVVKSSGSELVVAADRVGVVGERGFVGPKQFKVRAGCRWI